MEDVQDIFEELKTVYGESDHLRPTMKYWTKEFKGGRVSVLDEERSGRPQEISNDNELSSIIRSDRQITVKQLFSRLNASVGTVHERLKALGIRGSSLGFCQLK